jgi:hypothetical protein
MPPRLDPRGRADRHRLEAEVADALHLSLAKDVAVLRRIRSPASRRMANTWGRSA